MGRRVFVAAGALATEASVPFKPVVAPQIYDDDDATDYDDADYSDFSDASNIAADIMSPAAVVSPKKKVDIVSVLLYTAIPVLVVGGFIFGLKAFQSGAEVDSVVDSWNNVRDLANISYADGYGDAPTPEEIFAAYGDITDPMDENFVDTSFSNFIVGDSATVRDAEMGEIYTGEQGAAPSASTEASAAEGSGGDNSGGNNSGGNSGGTTANAAYTPARTSSPMERRIDWDAVRSTNVQTKCWIYIPGTLIDYPVVGEKNFGEYHFLDHDFYDRQSSSGCLVAPALPSGCTTDAQFIIFGHNMKNTTMFGTLRNYRTQQFYKSYPYIYIYYQDRVEKWEVWSCFHTTESDIIYDAPYELNSVAFKKLINQIEAQKTYTTNVVNSDASRGILTLSTCEKIDDTHKGRFVVNAVCVDTVRY